MPRQITRRETQMPKIEELKDEIEDIIQNINQSVE